MKKLHYIFLLIVLVFAEQIHAQGKPFLREFPILNREVNQSIYDLYVDNKGLLYLGTSLGLFSFNGVEVKTFDFKNNLSFSVDNIQQSSDGKIWCKNFSNEVFYLQNNTLQKDEVLDRFFQSIDAYLLDFIFVDEIMYVLLENSFVKYDLSENKITQVLNLEPGEEVFHAVNYNKTTSEIILGSDQNYYRIKDEKVIEKTILKKGTKSIHIYSDELFLINNTTKEVLKSNQPIYTQKEDSIKTLFYRFSELNSELWLSSSSGLFKFNDKTNSIERFGLSQNNVTDIVMDLEGNYWISTLDSGVFFMPNINLKLIGNSEGIETSSSQSYSTLISNLKNEFYAGTTNGKVLKFDLNNNLAFILDTETNLEIEYLFEDNEKLITSRGFFDFKNNNKFRESYIGKSIAKDNIGNYLISTYNLAGILNTDFSGSPKEFKKNLIDFGNLDAKISVLRNKRSRSCYFSKSTQNYYIGYSDGLFFYDGKLSQKELRHNDREIIAVSMLEDAKEDLWIATNRNGVLVSRNNKIIDSISTIDGLSNNKTKSIKINNGKVWILTETNLDFYDLYHKKVINIGNRLGLNGLILNDILILNDYLYIATNKGILYIKLIDLEEPLQPYFDVLVLGSKYRTTEESIFDYDENINIQFNSIYYKSFGDFNYSYILKPIQKQWQQQKAQNNELNFFTLPSGKYELIAKIDDQNIVSTEKRVEFEIMEPYWKKWWFTTLVAIVFLLVLTLIYKFAVYRTQKRQTLKEELATSQLTALRSQMNPHFIFNVLNSIQGLMYTNQKVKANDYMGKFAELMRNILDNSEEKFISLEDELHSIKLYIELEKSRFDDDDFIYDICIGDTINPSEIEIPSMIIQPFVENAIKHGLMHKRGKKKLDIKFEIKNTHLIIKIQDNGIGKKASAEINNKIKKHKSFATKAIDKRIDLMNKFSKSPISITTNDFSESSQQQTQGTLIDITIPLRHKFE